MSHSYSSNRIHLIFSTKHRQKRIWEDLQLKRWPYMAGIARNHGFEAIKVGGVEDDAHSLLHLPRAITLAKAVRGLSQPCSDPKGHLPIAVKVWRGQFAAPHAQPLIL